MRPRYSADVVAAFRTLRALTTPSGLTRGSVSPRVRRQPGTVYDVVGIGNALVDVITHHDDPFLESNSLVKGSMTLIDTDRALYLYKALGTAVEMSGGSAANTMTGVASFGGTAAYIGKVNDDELGQVFGHDLRAVGVQFRPGAHVEQTATGRCIIVVTPDAERTMNTYLGVSSLLCPSDIDQAAVAAGKVLYMEGYLYDRPEAKEAFRHAAEIAHANGRQVSLTLSDSFCVDRHRTDFRSLVTDQVDILFGNETELMSLYEVESFDEAIERVRRDCELAVITHGCRAGSIVTHHEVFTAFRRAGGPGARHHRRRRPVRRRVPLRLHPRDAVAGMRPARGRCCG